MFQCDDPQVQTAVEFLTEVFQKGLKGHKEAELRKYLFHRRRLTNAQVDQAFKIYNANIPSTEGGGNAEREEVTSQKKTSGDYDFLLPANRARGKNLVFGFLKTELNYCNVLECLIEEYYKHLCEMADRKKITISRKELEPIFKRVLQLRLFHKKFYVDLKLRKDQFGQLFVRHFNSFRDYVEYMKDCNNAIKKMREYIYDKKLRKSLDNVRLISRRPNDDMMDLILSPMDRIKDYKEFLDSLYEWADKKQESDYLYLGKASRRIGRIVSWIEMYKYNIINQNEMNKVQQFLDTQCSIISPSRRIVRRGLMIRRTTTWPARNKHYVFFLFNDVLLWTTRKGDLQNLVFLRDCEVRPSGSKYNRARKFEVVADGQRYKYHKLLKLECRDPRQRNEWYDVIKREISLAKDDNAKQDSKKTFGEEDLTKFIEKVVESPSPDITKPTDGNYSERKSDDGSDTAVESEDEEDAGRPTHRRLQSSRNFRAQEFNGSYAQLDEMSLTSETEQDLLIDTQDRYGASMGALFPNADGRVTNKASPDTKVQEEKVFSNDIYHNNGANTVERSKYTGSKEWLQAYHQKSNGTASGSRMRNEHSKGWYPSSSAQKKMNIIRQRRHYVGNLEKDSSFTIRLTQFDG
jgi:hypothetical protein